MEPGEQPIERGEAGPSFEDPVEAAAQGSFPLERRIPLVGLEIAVEPPDQASQALLRRAVPVGEGVELVDQPLGVNPAQPMAADIELAGIVADDDGLLE